MTLDNAVPERLSSQLTHYEVLDVSPNATLEEIKAAHRQLVLQSHPDKVGSHQEEHDVRFRLVQQAWECLRSSSSRQEYDMELSLQKKRRDSKRQAAFPIHLSELQVAQGEEETGSHVVYIHACRCGDEVQLWQEDVPYYNESILLECPGCSFCFSIINNLQ
jgi:diphthamide biosynthesis protein 4